MGITMMKHVYQEEAGGTGGTGGTGTTQQPTQVAPADARKFVSDFVHDPKVLESMKDEDVVAYHGRVTQTIDKVRPKGGTWPEKWRDEFSGGDAEVGKRFERYQSPKDVAQALVAAQNKIRSGELKETKAFPDKGTDAEKTAWFKENNLPATPAEYKLKLKDGLVIGDEDRPIVDTWLNVAHSARLNDAQASAFVDFYYGEQERQAAARDSADKDIARKTSDALHAEWGKEYRENMNIYDAMVVTLPESVREKVTRGRLADGTPIGSSPEFVRWVVSMGRELNPAGLVIPAGAGGIAGSVDDEIKAIEKDMGSAKGTPAYKAYWEDEKRQARLRTLYTARERAQGKG